MGNNNKLPDNIINDIIRMPDDQYNILKARKNLLDFVLYTFPGYQVNWHHKVMCKYLERWAFGDIKRLMIFMPPRSGKSELVSRRLPSWIFGRDPNASIISTSYTADLASSMNKDVQRVMENDSYHKVFPKTNLAGKSNRRDSQVTYRKTSDLFEIVNYKGVYKSAGVGGGITGRGFSHGIIDDPIRSRRDAESLTNRETLWKWYTDDFYTRRINKDARILITQTRWHAEDLSGKLLDMMHNEEKAEKWTIVSFPMILDTEPTPGDPRKFGEALWPDRLGTPEELESVKVNMGSYSWSALYQQSPTVSGGSIFNRGWWDNQYYDLDPISLIDKMSEIIMVWDCTFKEGPSNDYVVGQVWGLRKNTQDKYLLDQVRGQMDFIDTINSMQTLSGKWPQAHRKLIEEKANGPAVISSLRHKVSGLIPINPGRDSKVTRAQGAAPDVEAGNVFLPSPRYAPWIHDFVEECAAFPNGKHDDMVDCLGYAIAALRKSNIPLPKIPTSVISSSMDNQQNRNTSQIRNSMQYRKPVSGLVARSAVIRHQ